MNAERRDLSSIVVMVAAAASACGPAEGQLQEDTAASQAPIHGLGPTPAPDTVLSELRNLR